MNTPLSTQTENRVNRILFNAEKMISYITGYKVMLNMSVVQTYDYHRKVGDAICKYFKTTWIHMVGRSRKREMVLARQIFTYLVYEDADGCRYPDIARMLNRHHSSVILARRKFKDALEVNDTLATEALENIKRILEDDE